MAYIIKAIAGITALLLLIVTLFGSLITLGGFLLSAIKALIVVIFIALIVILVFSLLRHRCHRRSEVRDI